MQLKQTDAISVKYCDAIRSIDYCDLGRNCLTFYREV